MEGNPRLEVASVGVGGKPIPGDGEPVIGAVQAIPGYHVAFSHSGATLGLIVGELLAYEVATGARHPMLATFRPEQFTGAETRAIKLQLGPNSFDFVGKDYLLGFGTPNVYFHYTMVYAILRHNGLAIGKRDYVG